MRSQSHWPGGPPAPPVADKNGLHQNRSWGADLRERFTGAVIISVLITGLILLASTGLFRNRPISSSGIVDADSLWAAMLLGSAPLIWAIEQVKFGRDDNGFRTRGLPSLMFVNTVLAAIIQMLFMLTWSLVVDESVPEHAALAQYHSDLLAFGLIAVFVIGLYAWAAVATLGSVGKRLATSVIGSLAWIVVAGLGIWQGIFIFENRATVGSFWV